MHNLKCCLLYKIYALLTLDCCTLKISNQLNNTYKYQPEEFINVYETFTIQ